MANPWEKYSQQGPVTIGTPDPAMADKSRKIRNEAEASDLTPQLTEVELRNKSEQRGDRAFDEAQKLRNEFQKQPSVITFDVALGTYNSSLKTADNAQGDQSLITAYAKMLDPTSAVREGEFATTANTQNMIGQIKSKIAKEFGTAGGGMLTDKGRDAIRNEMRNLVLNRFKVPYDRDRMQYEAIAKTYGIDPYVVTGEQALSQYPDDLLDPPTVPGDSPLSPEQQRVYDSIMAANPNATADQLNAIFDAAGFPKVENLGDIIEARKKGAGVMPGSSAVPGDAPPQEDQGYQQSQLGQGMAGVNEGIAGTLGLPVDAATWAMNLVPQGINAIANTNIPQIENPVMGSDWITNQMQNAGAIYPENSDGTGGFTRRVGQSLGGAVIPGGALSRTGREFGGALLSATSGGIGGASAQKIFPDNQWAELGGEVLGSGMGAGGLLANIRRQNQAAIEAKVPTVDQLKAQAGKLYDEAELRGVTASPQQTQQYADDMARMLRDEGQLGPSGRISDADTSATKAFNLVNQYAGQPMRPKEMDTVRKVIADGRKSTDASDLRITNKLLGQHDDFATPLAPEFGQARDISSRYLQAQDLEQARDLAGARSGQFSGSGFENALRTEYRALDRNSIKGKNFFSDDVMEPIEKVSRGTPLSNTARNIGRFAPTGPVSTSLATGGGITAGAMLGGPAGGLAGGALAAGLGYGGRGLATKLGIRNANIAELTARNGGKLPQAALIDPNQAASASGAFAGQLVQYLDENGRPYDEQYGNIENNPELLPRRIRGGIFGASR